jgi:hypothetical protein
MLTLIPLVLLQGGANELTYGRIQLGMTRREVQNIVRIPPVTKVTDDDRFLQPFTMLSHHIRQKGELWRSGTRKLWVVFDKDQRVTAKMLEDDEVDPVSEWLKQAARAKKGR